MFTCQKSAYWCKLVRRYSRTPVTRTLKGNEKQFELATGFELLESIAKFNLPYQKLIVTDF